MSPARLAGFAVVLTLGAIVLWSFMYRADPALTEPRTRDIMGPSYPAVDSGAGMHPSTQDSEARQDVTLPANPDPKPGGGAAALEEAKRKSSFGRLNDSELTSLLELLSNRERGSDERLHGYLSSAGEVGSVEHADYVFDVEGARAKSMALLEGSYLLLGSNEDPPTAISGDPMMHLVQGPGFERDGKPLLTHIVIDLGKHGRFAESKWALERKLREREANNRR